MELRIFIDIHSKSPYPSGSLSNFAEHPYCLDGIPIKCQEGLLQSLKVPPELQRTICMADARAAKEIGSTYNWQESGAIFHWNGRYFSRYSKKYQDFLKRSYDALVDQNDDFAKALLDSGHAILWHSIGRLSRKQTCLTTFEFISLLYPPGKEYGKSIIGNKPSPFPSLQSGGFFSYPLLLYLK